MISPTKADFQSLFLTCFSYQNSSIVAIYQYWIRVTFLNKFKRILRILLWISDEKNNHRNIHRFQMSFESIKNMKILNIWLILSANRCEIEPVLNLLEVTSSIVEDIKMQCWIDRESEHTFESFRLKTPESREYESLMIVALDKSLWALSLFWLGGAAISFISSFWFIPLI